MAEPRARAPGQIPRWMELAVVTAIAMVLVASLFLAWSNAELTAAVAAKNETISELRRVVDRMDVVLAQVDSSEKRAQCYFTLIAERSLVEDPAVADQMARDYLEGRRCPATGPTSPP